MNHWGVFNILVITETERLNLVALITIAMMYDVAAGEDTSHGTSADECMATG